MAFSRNIAVVIGINQYQQGISSLATAVNDASEVSDSLRHDHNYQGWCLLDEEATLQNLKHLLEDILPQQVTAADRLLFYFAGHGIALNGEEGPEGYLIPQDAALGDTDSYLPMAQLQAALSSLPCRHFLGFLDCCFAGAFRWSSTRKASVVPTVIHQERYDRFISDPAWQVITSAAADQTAADSLGFQTERGKSGHHSPFAAALLDALAGKADLYPVSSHGRPAGDGVITATELYLYLRDAIEPAIAQGVQRQTPGLWPLKKHDKGEYIFLSPGHPLNLPPAPPLDASRNPYRGLESFDESHSDLFFGRAERIEALQTFVETHSLTVVLGPSGSGKSSLVKAGLMPKLRQDTAEQWCVLPSIRPGDKPLQALKHALESLLPTGAVSQGLNGGLKCWVQAHPDAKVLLFIDQSEELVTLCRSECDRKTFLQEIFQAVNDYHNNLRVVLSLRTDFESQVKEASLSAISRTSTAENTALKDAWQSGRFIVPAMTRADLREAIEKPAEARVMYFQPYSLVEQLIDEVFNMPGALPLLSFALSELYLKYLRRQREAENSGITIDRTLSEADYQELGGVIQSLTQRADEEYETLVGQNPAYGQIIRHVMLRMVALGGGELARRRVLLSELNYPLEKNSGVKAVIEHFTTARLLVKGKDSEGNPYVEPAHDALVRGWQKLLLWKQADEESLLLQRRLTPAAQEWKEVKEKGENPKLKIKGGAAINLAVDGLDHRLHALENLCLALPARAARLWPRSHDSQKPLRAKNSRFLWNADPYLEVLDKQLKSDNNWLNQIEAEFVQKSVVQKHRNIRWRWRIAIAVILGLSGLTTISLIGQRNTLISQARSSQKAAQAHLSTSQSLDGMVEGLQAAKALQHPLVQNPLLKRLGSAKQLQTLHEQIEGTLQWAVYRVRETSRMTDEQSTIVRSVVSPMHDSLEHSLIASAGENGRIDLWDLQGSLLQSWKEKSLRVWNVDFSPDSQSLASAGEDGTVRIWNLQAMPSAEVEPVKEISAHQGYVRYVSFSPDGQTLATVGGRDGMMGLWDLQGNELAFWRAEEAFAKTVDFHPHDPIAVTLGMEGKVKIWNLASVTESARPLDRPNSVPQPLQTLDFFGWGAYFSPNGRYLAAAGNDGSIRVWGNQNQAWTFLKDWPAHEGRIWNIAFSLDSQLIASGGEDGSVQIWDLQGERLADLRGHTGPVRSVRFTGDRKQIVSSGDDGSTRLWNLPEPLSNNPSSAPPQGSSHPLEKVLLSSEGELLALASRAPDGLNQSMFSEFNDLVISPDGTLLAAASLKSKKDNRIYVWDLETGQRLNTFRDHVGEVVKLNFSSDSKQLVSAGKDKTIRVWSDISQKGQGRYRSIFRAYRESLPSMGTEQVSEITAVSFSSDSRRLVSSDSAGYIRFWDLDQNQQTAVWRAHHHAITALSFSPKNDAILLATVGEEGTMRLPIESLDALVKRSCDQIGEFLRHSPESSIDERDRQLCKQNNR